MQAFFSAGELAAWAAERSTSHWLWLTGQGLTLLLFLILLLGGAHLALRRLAERVAGWLYDRRALQALGRVPLLGRIRGAFERLARGRPGDPQPPERTQWLVDALVPVFFLVLFRVVFLPLDFFSDYLREAERGLLTSSLGLYWLDRLKSLGLGILYSAFLGIGLFGLARRLPRSWWIWLSGAVVGMLIVWSVLSPYRARIYHRFEPLPAGALRSQLATVLGKAGLELEEVEVVDTSRRTRRVNAYIMGHGPSRRVVLSDTLLQGFHPREIAFVVAHEAAHETREDPMRTLLATALGALVFLAACRWVFWRAGRSRWLGLKRSADPAALPILLLVFELLLLVNQPLSRYLSREEELEADRIALDWTRDPVAYGSAMIRLNRINQSDPDPPAWDRFLFCGHPTTAERIRLGFEWAARNQVRMGPGALPLPAPLAQGP